MFQIKVVEEKKTHFQCLFSLSLSKNCAVNEIMSTSVVEPEGPQKVRRMRVAFWIVKATRAPAHARALAPTRMHTRALIRARAHTRTQRNI